MIIYFFILIIPSLFLFWIFLFRKIYSLPLLFRFLIVFIVFNIYPLLDIIDCSVYKRTSCFWLGMFFMYIVPINIIVIIVFMVIRKILNKKIDELYNEENKISIIKIGTFLLFLLSLFLFFTITEILPILLSFLNFLVILIIVILFKRIEIKKRTVFIFLSLILVILMNSAIILLDSECQKTDSGWMCRFRTGITERLYENKCNIQTGRWKCYGNCQPFYEHYCDFPFEDSWKRCLNSNECKGRCYVSTFEEQIERDCFKKEEKIICKDWQGQCSEYPLRECDRFYELNDGVLTKNFSPCALVQLPDIKIPEKKTETQNTSIIKVSEINKAESLALEAYNNKNLKEYYDIYWENIGSTIVNTSSEWRPFLSEHGWKMDIPPKYVAFSGGLIPWLKETENVRFYEKDSFDTFKLSEFEDPKGLIIVESFSGYPYTTDNNEITRRIENIHKADQIINLEKIQFGNYSAIKVVYISSYYKAPKTQWEAMVIGTNNYVYEISFGSDNIELVDKPISEYGNYSVYQKMLSTFRFLE